MTPTGKLLVGVGVVATGLAGAGVVAHYGTKAAASGAAPGGSILVVPDPTQMKSYTLSLKAAGVGAQPGQILLATPGGSSAMDAAVTASSNPLVVPVRSYGPGQLANTTLYVATRVGSTVLTITWSGGTKTAKVAINVVP